MRGSEGKGREEPALQIFEPRTASGADATKTRYTRMMYLWTDESRMNDLLNYFCPRPNARTRFPAGVGISVFTSTRRTTVDEYINFSVISPALVDYRTVHDWEPFRTTPAMPKRTIRTRDEGRG